MSAGQAGGRWGRQDMVYVGCIVQTWLRTLQPFMARLFMAPPLTLCSLEKACLFLAPPLTPCSLEKAADVARFDVTEEMTLKATRDLRNMNEKLNKVEPGLEEIRKQLADLALKVEVSAGCCCCARCCLTPILAMKPDAGTRGTGTKAKCHLMYQLSLHLSLICDLSLTANLILCCMIVSIGQARGYCGLRYCVLTRN